MSYWLACPDSATVLEDCVEIAVQAQESVGFTAADVAPLLGIVASMLVIGFVIQRVRRVMGG